MQLKFCKWLARLFCWSEIIIVPIQLLACTEISPDLEEKSVKWLKKQLPRHTKVNLKPKGSVDGVLVARVIPFDTNIDLAEKYINEGLATNKC